jgi:putative transposase
MRLRKQGKPWNHKKVYRVYKLIHYEKRSHLQKRLPARVKHPLTTLDSPNHTWPLDFVSDRLECNRKFRVLNVLDDFGRRAVAQEVSMSMRVERVVKLLEKIIWIHGKPVSIRCDNGPEFISLRFRLWCEVNAIEI